MTNEKEAPEWWKDNKYWEEGMDYRGYDSYDPKMDLIVAEAMRRGEAKAWEKIKEVVVIGKKTIPIFEADEVAKSTAVFVLSFLQNEIDAKLTSLKKV